MYRKILKRFLDLFFACAILILLIPVYLSLYLMVRYKLGSPAIFSQERLGLHGKIFTMYKFRSMSDERDEKGELLPDEIRLTPFGKILRRSSLDELPELFNILKGEMSFVGPRPLLVRYLERYSPYQARRHEVKPGLTGWAQVNGRNAISWEEKFERDVWYVDHQSFRLDLKILFMTVESVFKRQGISSESSATMEEFMGSFKESGEQR